MLKSQAPSRVAKRKRELAAEANRKNQPKERERNGEEAASQQRSAEPRRASKRQAAAAAAAAAAAVPPATKRSASSAPPRPTRKNPQRSVARRALSRSRADGADPEPQRAARKPRAKARSATPAPRAGLRQSRRIAGRAEVDGSAAETETDPNRHASSSDSDSDCDEDWTLPRPKEEARVKLRVKPSPGKQRATYKRGKVSSVDDLHKKFTVVFDGGDSRDFKWCQASKGDLTFEDASEGLTRLRFDQIDHERVDRRDRKLMAKVLGKWSVGSRFFNRWKFCVESSKAEEARRLKQPAPPVPPTPRARKSYQVVPGRTGLRNLGNTCYLNSVVQCMSSIEPVNNFFRTLLDGLPRPQQSPGVEPQQSTSCESESRSSTCAAPTPSPGARPELPPGELQRTDTIALAAQFRNAVPLKNRRQPKQSEMEVNYRKHKVELSCRMSNLLRMLWSGQLKVVTPSRLLGTVYDLAPRFAGFEQQDAQDFLYFLLDQTSTELSKTNALHFEHSHIPKEAFLGKLKSQLRCSGGEESSCPGCSSSPRIESFMDLSLDLQSEKLDGQIRTLDECLQRFVSGEAIDGYKCDSCGRIGTTTKALSIEELPAVLCFHLKRWRTLMRKSASGAVSFSRTKDNSRVGFDETMDMAKYLTKNSGSEDGVVNTRYELRAVVVHHGSGSSAGHYTAYARAGLDNWLHFNDDRCLQATTSEVLNSSPYILFYQRK